MKKEYKEKLDKMYWFFNNYKNIAKADLHEHCMNDFVYPMDELSETGEQEILECLLDFFDRQFDDDINGVSESLESDVQCNFTSDQIIEAFYKKFDSFMEKNSMRCMKISMRFFDEGNETDFLKFRVFFNFVKSKHAKELLDIFKEWFKYGWSEKSKNYVYTLENDMKKWREPQKKII